MWYEKKVYSMISIIHIAHYPFNPVLKEVQTKWGKDQVNKGDKVQKYRLVIHRGQTDREHKKACTQGIQIQRAGATFKYRG